MACSVAALPTWRGLKVRGGPVAIIAGEDPDGLHLMLHAWEQQHGGERDELGCGASQSPRDQYAPRPESTAGMVLAMIVMSSQIDQLSR